MWWWVRKETRPARRLLSDFRKNIRRSKWSIAPPRGAQLPPKLLAEQKAERYSVDVLVQGTTTVINGLIPVKAVMPIQPYLVGPNSRDSAHGLTKSSVSLTKPDNITWQ